MLTHEYVRIHVMQQLTLRMLNECYATRVCVRQNNRHHFAYFDCKENEVCVCVCCCLRKKWMGGKKTGVKWLKRQGSYILYTIHDNGEYYNIFCMQLNRNPFEFESVLTKVKALPYKLNKGMSPRHTLVLFGFSKRPFIYNILAVLEANKSARFVLYTPANLSI